jgi:glycosyl hydrolase family 28
MTGGVSGVFARNIQMTSPNIRSALRLKTNSLRGGFITDVHLRDIEVSEVTLAGIEIDFFYEDVGPGQGFDPSVGDVNVENLHVDTTQFALNLRGYPNDPIRGVVLQHCAFDHAPAGNVVENVEGLRLIDVTINGRPAGARAPAAGRA